MGGGKRLRWERPLDANRERQHQESIEEGKENYTRYCPECPFQTRSEQRFKEHWKDKHTRPS